jgi:hypothetical protein
MTVETKRKYNHYDSASRKRLVNLVKVSTNKSVSDVADENGISRAVLWSWCNALLGPRIRKQVAQRGCRLRGARVSDAAKVRNANSVEHRSLEISDVATSSSAAVPEGSSVATQKVMTRKNKSATVTITLDADGKINRYEVTGDVNVLMFTQVPKTM